MRESLDAESAMAVENINFLDRANNLPRPVFGLTSVFVSIGGSSEQIKAVKTFEFDRTWFEL